MVYWFCGWFLEGKQTGEEEGHNSAQHQDNLFPATCDCCSLSYLPNLKELKNMFPPSCDCCSLSYLPILKN
jgi:hypothetical protein